MTEEISFHRLTGTIGARVDGVDLTTDLDQSTIDAIHAGLVEYGVLFFREQFLDDDQQLAFAHRFGETSVYPIAKVLGMSRKLTEIEDTPDNPPNADNWHTDMSFLPEPPKIAVLSALVIPPYGGDTMWASLTAMHDAMSEPMQEFCATLEVRHDADDSFWNTAETLLDSEKLGTLRQDLFEVVHPLVIRHPDTGRRALYVSGDVFMSGIVGLSDAESRVLFAYFRSLIDDPNNVVRWNWRAGDVAMWDERITNHRALADHFPQHRKMRRCTIDGERLVAAGPF